MSANTTPGISAPTKQSSTSNVKSNRLPAPTLFVGPPSRNASQLSILKAPAEPTSKTGRPSAIRQKSALNRSFRAQTDTTTTATTTNNNNATDTTRDPKEASRLRKPSEKSIDARWREMQSTLNEVELTAQGSTHVFGDSHTRALDDLRQAQVALAQAWGRGSENEATLAADEVGEVNVGQFKQHMGDKSPDSPKLQHRARAETEGSVSTVLSDESQLSESSARSGRSQLEDETAQDIKLAGERRAANEAYFKRVDEGVKEVVEKLEAVAEAMRGVEGESRSLWSNSDRSESDIARVDVPQVAVSTP